MSRAEFRLLSRERLEGDHRVAVTARPVRVAHLIDARDPASALSAIAAASIAWGGRCEFLIPCLPGNEPSGPWTRILDIYDPDYVQDLVGVAPTYTASRREQYGWEFSPWEQSTDTIKLEGALVYAALRGRVIGGFPKRNGLIYLNPLLGQPLALPLAYRFGHFDRRPMAEDARLRPLYEGGRFEEFFSVKVVDPGTLPQGQLVRWVTDPHVPFDAPDLGDVRGGIDLVRTLPMLSTFGMPAREPAYADNGPESQDHREAYYRRIVVVGGDTSVPDLCLAWNLRAQRAVAWEFPVWVTPEWLNNSSVHASLREALNVGRPSMTERDFPEPTLHLVSTSLARDELESAAEGLPIPHVAYDPALIDRFFTGAFCLGQTREASVAFRGGRANVPVPDFAEFATFDGREVAAWTVAIDGHVAPRSGRDRPRRFGASSRVARDGFAGYVNEPEPWTLLPVGTSSGWEIVEGLTAAAGYMARPSDKGRLGVSILDLLADRTLLDILASSRVYDLLQKMAANIPRQAVQQALRESSVNLLPEQLETIADRLQMEQVDGGQFDRQHWTHGKLTTALDVPAYTCEAVIRRLVQRRVLLRGYEVACPNCGIRRWYSIDRLSHEHACDACQVVTPDPLPLDRLDWRYRLNEAIARAVDQGVLPHLLAARRMLGWIVEDHGDFLGFFPGVVLQSQEDGEGPQSMEVDLFAIKAGRVILAECKQTGTRLAVEEVERFATIGRILNCSRILYATVTEFGESAALQRAREVSAPAVVEVWDRDDLIDVWPGADGRTATARDYLIAAGARLTDDV